MTKRPPWWRDWGPIIAALALLNTVGWSMYGMSAKAKQDVEDRLRAVEITVARMGAQIEGLRNAGR